MLTTIAHHAAAAGRPGRKPRLVHLRVRAALLLLAPLAAASVQAATTYAVSYFSLPGMASTTLFDIDNQGRLLAWGLANQASTYAGYLVEQGVAQPLVAPNGGLALGRGFSETGLIVGSVVDPTRTTSSGGQVTVGFISDSAGGWRQIESPLPGDPFTTVSAVSADGRYITGVHSSASNSSTQYQQDLSTGNRTSIPSSVGLFNVYAVDDRGRIYGSSRSLPRQAVLYDPATAQRSVLPDLGFRSLLARAVNASGLMAGSLTTQAGDGRAWVGSASTVTVLDTKPGFASAAGMNDLGQVVGSWSSEDGNEQLGFIATPVQLPLSGGAPGVFSFSIDVVADQPVFIDPVVAVGYVYATGAGDPLFKTVSLPLGIGDGRYTLSVGGQTLDIGGNQIVDFTALGFAQGVAGFTVTGIETSAMLDPTDASAFVTRLTFMTSGRFTGTQTALTMDVTAVPEPGTVALWLLGLASLAVAARPQNRRHGRRHHPSTREVCPAAGDGEARPAA